jgi:hypothetical protein
VLCIGLYVLLQRMKTPRSIPHTVGDKRLQLRSQGVHLAQADGCKCAAP